MHRVVAVVAGVLLAVALADLAGFTWWSLGITIAAGLAVGYALHLGDAVLEVPISAMLILSNATRAAAVGRIAETAIGAAAGLAAGFVFTYAAAAAGRGGRRGSVPQAVRSADRDGRRAGRRGRPGHGGCLAGRRPAP